MLLRILKIALKVFDPLVVLAFICFTAAFVISYYPEILHYRGFAPFSDPERNYWIVLILCILGVIYSLIALMRFLTWLFSDSIPNFWDWFVRKFRRKIPEQVDEILPDLIEVELAALEGIFKASSAILKKRWRLSTRDRYEFPWYLVLGPASAGKTALIDSSNLKFPIDNEIKAAHSAFGDTLASSMFEWRIAGNDATLLELNSKWLEQDGENNDVRAALWSKFQELLLELRVRQPLTGTIVVVDLAELSDQSQRDRDETSKAIRRKIAELSTNLHTKMTLHMVFSQLDRLSGFRECMSLLTPLQRAELAGISVVPSENQEQTWQATIDDEYRALAERLTLYIRDVLPTLSVASERQDAIAFGQTFSGLRAPILEFLTATFDVDKFTTMPHFRGVFFVSSRQENDQRSVFLNEVANVFRLQEPVFPVLAGKSVPFFAEELMSKVVFAEAWMAGENTKNRKKQKQRLSLAWLVGLATIGLCTYGWWESYVKQTRLIARISEDTRAFSSSRRISGYDEAGREVLPALNLIGESASSLGRYWLKGSVTSFIRLDVSNELGPLADLLYREQLNDFFVPSLIAGIEKRLQDQCARGTSRQLQTLNTYLMLGDLKARNNADILNYFSEYWQAEFPAEAKVQSALIRHMEYALEVAPVAYETNNSLIQRTQTDLRTLSPNARVFAELQTVAARQLPNPLAFTAQIGTSFDRVYVGRSVDTSDLRALVSAADCSSNDDGTVHENSLEIPRLFTRSGFLEFFIPKLSDVSRIAARDLWTLGLLETAEYSEADYNAIRDRLRQTYVDEYIRIWRQTLHSLELQDFTSLSSAVEVTGLMSALDSPLVRLAELVRDNTLIYQPRAVDIESRDAIEGIISFDPNIDAGLQVNAAFRAIHDLLDSDSESTRPNIDEILTAIANVNVYLKSIEEAPSRPARALELAKDRVNLVGDDPIYVLRQIARRVPAPFDAHLTKIADESWRIILLESVKELDRLWREEVYGYFTLHLEGRYPIERRAAEDVSLEQFREFFAPSGILRTFFDQELSVFIHSSTRIPRNIEGQQLPIHAAFVNNLHKALEVSPAFFGPDGALRVEYVVMPLGMNTALSRASLNFEGQMVINSHRAARGVQVVWPNLLGAPELSRYDLFSISGNQQSFSRSFSGPWSWLKLYDAAEKGSISGGSIDVILLDDLGRDAHFRFSSGGNVNPFFNSPFDDFSLPVSLTSDREARDAE